MAGKCSEGREVGSCAPAQRQLGRTSTQAAVTACRGFPRTVTVVDFFNSQMQICERGKMTSIEIAGLAQSGCVVGNVLSVTYKLGLKFFRVHKTFIILIVLLQNIYV